MNDLEKLFVSELKDIYDGEQQLVKALPEMEKNAASEQLKQAFHQHWEQTKTHIDRLERVFHDMGEEPKRKNCTGLEGIIDEGEVMAKEFADNSALDAALIEAGQKAEHYEITSYGTLCEWARELGRRETLALLEQTLSEEKDTDQMLTRLAQVSRNPEARARDSERKSQSSSVFSKIFSPGT